MSTIDTSALKSLGLTRDLSKQDDRKRLGQEDFLKLMTTQVQNQDPFKPMKNGDFLAQMAQFGTVSGIQDLQKSFQSLAGSLSSNQDLQAASLVGRQVLVPSNRGVLPQSGSLKGGVSLSDPANNVRINVYDAGGQLVHTKELGAHNQGQVSYQWDGIRDDGSRAPAGTYFVQAEAVFNGKNVDVEHLSQAQVESVTFGRAGEGLRLNLAGLGEAEFSDVRQIR